MMNRAEDLASGTFYLTIMQASQYIVAFVFYVIVARLLSPGEVGSLSLLLMILAVFNTLTLLALNNAVIKYVSESMGAGDRGRAASASRKALKLIIGASLPALAFGLAFSPILSARTGTGILEVSVILVTAFTLNLTSYYGAVMYGLSMFRLVSAQNVLYVTSSRLLGVLLALLGLRVLGLSLGFLAGSIITLLYSAAVLRGRMSCSEGDFPSAELLRFSLPVYGANVIGLTQSWLDVAVLSGIAGLSVAGTYYIAVSSVAPLSILWIPLSSALFPTFSWINGSGNRDEILEMHRRVLRIATAIILPLSIALASVSQTALSIVYGSAYAEASLPFTILASLSILNAYSSIYSVELQSIGRTKPIFVAGAASTAAYMLLLSTTTGLLGRVGAALARAAMIAIGFSILHREMGVKAPENLARSMIVAIVVASALAPMELLLKADLYLKASIEALAFTAALLIAFKLVKPLDSNEVGLVKSIMPWRTRAYKPTA
jgi:PST family polysaccharide transporter